MKKYTLSEYENCVRFLFSLERAEMKYDLNNITALCEFLGNPQKCFKSVHIAGTNGKGSVSAIINSVLMEKGLKTGLYTSPHLIDFRERILVNGEMVSKKFVVDFTNSVMNIIKEKNPSFYEVSTAMAFAYFASKKVDYAIVETGLGGRLDSTNILTPVISVITGISIDHTEYLGNSIGSISREKAGIIKPGIPCVSGKVGDIPLKIFREKCRKEKSELLDSAKKVKVDILKRSEYGITVNVKGKLNIKNLKFPLAGDFQALNISTALTALNKLSESQNLKMSTRTIKSGLTKVRENSKIYGRFQVVKRNPYVIIDVSHNVEGLKNLPVNLMYMKYRRLFILFGLMKDKETGKCVRELELANGLVILTKPDYKRAEEPEKLFEYAKYKNRCLIIEKVKDAYSFLKSIAEKDDLILITGSFYLAGEVLRDVKELRI